MKSRGTDFSTGDVPQERSSACGPDCGCAQTVLAESDKPEAEAPVCVSGCCCGLSGPGGRARLILSVVVVAIGIVLMVHGFAAGG